MGKKEFPIPDWSQEEFINLAKRSSEGDKISQDLFNALFQKHLLPDLEKILRGENDD